MASQCRDDNWEVQDDDVFFGSKEQKVKEEEEDDKDPLDEDFPLTGEFEELSLSDERDTMGDERDTMVGGNDRDNEVVSSSGAVRKDEDDNEEEDTKTETDEDAKTVVTDVHLSAAKKCDDHLSTAKKCDDLTHLASQEHSHSWEGTDPTEDTLRDL